MLFLDDDVRLHPGTIGASVACIEENPKVIAQIADGMQVFSCPWEAADPPLTF